MLPDRILEACLNGACFTKREMFPLKKKKDEVTTASLIMLQLMPVDCLQSIENTSRNLGGTTQVIVYIIYFGEYFIISMIPIVTILNSNIFQVCGYGEVKILSCHLKFGCVVEILFGCHAPESPTFIVDTLVHLVILEVLPTNLKDSLQH